MIALVFGVMAASIFAGSMHFVLRVAIDENRRGARNPDRLRRGKKRVRMVITSSPGPMPSAISASQIASVPFPTPMAYFVPLIRGEFLLRIA